MDAEIGSKWSVILKPWFSYRFEEISTGFHGNNRPESLLIGTEVELKWRVILKIRFIDIDSF